MLVLTKTYYRSMCGPCLRTGTKCAHQSPWCEYLSYIYIYLDGEEKSQNTKTEKKNKYTGSSELEVHIKI